MSNFIVQFPLITEKFQEDVLNKRFEIGRKIYNALVIITQKRHKEMVKTKAYRNCISFLSKEKEQNQIIYQKIQKLRKEYSLTEYSFHADVKKLQKHFKANIDAFTAQKIASSLWKAYEKLFYGNGKTIHYKKFGSFNFIEGKSNKTGIRYKDHYIEWNGLKLPVKIDDHNPYEKQAMQFEISYCRLIRKFIKNKYKFYVQIVFKGKAPIKIDRKTGQFKRPIGKGDVGLDIGTSTIAIASERDVKIIELADQVQNIEHEKRRILRKIGRSRRATNPDHFNDDGTFKKNSNKKVKWLKTKRYLKLQNELKELHRRQADVRKYQHECLANYIISLGNNIYVEEMNFPGLQKRAKKTEKNEGGKFKRKKRFGKTIAHRAPAMLLTIMNRKLQYHDANLIKINTKEARASQFNHFDESYAKKKLSKRWNDFNGISVQRDLYSAFLIMNIDQNLKSFDLKKCHERFDHFYELHQAEVKRLMGNKNVSSIAI